MPTDDSRVNATGDVGGPSEIDETGDVGGASETGLIGDADEADEIIAKIIETQKANLDFLTDELIWFQTSVDETPSFLEMSREQCRAWLEYGFDHLSDVHWGKAVDEAQWTSDMAASWVGAGYRGIEASLHGTLVFVHLLVPLVRNAFADDPIRQLRATEIILGTYRKSIRGHLKAYEAIVGEVCEAARGSRAEHADAVRFDELLTAKTAGLPEDADVALTEREKEVLKLVGLGYENGEICARLHISQNTVKGHIRTLLMKTTLHNRTQLALYAVASGLCSHSEISLALKSAREGEPFVS